MSSQKRVKRLKQVRRALRYWDPLTVIVDPDGGTGLNDDEYDSYARGVLRLLEAGRDWRGLALHLVQLRLGWFGEGDEAVSELEAGLVQRLIVWRDQGFGREPEFDDL